MTQETDIAWAAGFFDGEGCVCLKNLRGKITGVHITIVQVRREPLDRFHRAMEGRGRVTGPSGPYGNQRQAHHRFIATNRQQVSDIAKLLWPYLSKPKREQFSRVFREFRNRGVDSAELTRI